MGKKGKIITFLANSLSIYGALTAYTIGAGETLKALFGGNSMLYSIIFFLILAIVIYFSVNALSIFESLFTPLKIIIVIILSILLIKFVNLQNISGFSLKNLLIPYGVILFSFTGISAIPEMNEELKNKKNLLKAILIGMVITLFIYLIFIFAVVGAVRNVNEVATLSLNNVSRGISIFGNLFALFALGTAFVALAYALKENLLLDYKINNHKSWFIVVVVPLILTITGFFGFVKLMELTGAIALGILFSVIIIMHSKAKKLGKRKPEFTITNNYIIKGILFLILIMGIVYSIW